MGVVYKAHDTRLKRRVALKFLPPAISEDPEAKKRFINEARTASALDHPNICSIYDIEDNNDGNSFIAMAYYEGISLKKKIEYGPFNYGEVVYITLQLLNGLSRAHNEGIVHRDIKPANIFLTQHKEVKILDFGLAKLAGQSRITHRGAILGTTTYMSPEQLQGQKPDLRCDIWSLGVVMYEMLSGKVPFAGNSEQAIIYSILNTEPESLHKFRPNIPENLEKIVMRAMAYSPDKRYQNALEMYEDLESLKEKSQFSEIKQWPTIRHMMKTKTKRPWYLYMLATSVIAAVILSLWYFDFFSDDPINSLAVLPMQNLSGDPDQEYFADGMTIELIGELARISSFERVISWTSVANYKTNKKPLKEIARELNVSAIVEAAVIQRGRNVRIRASLIEAETEKHLWTETYERPLEEIIKLQGELSKAIVNTINLNLTPAEEQHLTVSRQVNTKAYDAYLMGNYFFNKKNFHKGIQYFWKAIAIDSNYVEAHTGIASAYMGLLFHWFPYSNAIPIIRQEIQKAIKLDSLNEATQQAQAMLHMLEWDWLEAERKFKFLLVKYPNNPLVHSGYGIYLILNGRTEEGIEEKKRHLELDPLAVLSNTNLVWAYYNGRQYDNAIRQALRVLEIDSTHFFAQRLLAYSYITKGMPEKALLIARKHNFEKINPAVASVVYASAGLKDAAEIMIEHVDEVQYSSDIIPALILLGQHKNALDLLERTCKAHKLSAAYAKVDPLWDPIRSFPQYQNILKRIGYPHN
jgi:serine/threonine-protein kinase